MTPPAAGRFAIVAGALSGGCAVAAGAFGAHGLEAMLAKAGQTDNWETACRYALFHALALVATGLLARLPAAPPPGVLRAATACFLVGMLIFSGCLAILAVTGITMLGAIVPIGGVLLLAGWALMGLAAWKL